MENLYPDTSVRKLAIVIPAYKIGFFKESVKSIANQTCKDFTLYIGDDASPSDFSETTKLYRDRISIVYKRFEKNLGRDNLVSHWNRCIDLVQKEEWVWLFSDDDVMEDNCVELFYKHIETHENHSLLHFNIQVINEKNVNMYKAKKFQQFFTSADFFSQVLNRKVFSTVVEYIFKKEVFEKVNRFESFDLAWSSDVATWMKLALWGGINTIEGATVKWRVSSLNITSISDDKSIVLRKAKANVDFLKWAKLFFYQNNLTDITSEIEKVRWLMVVIVYTSSLNYNEKYKLIIDSLKILSLDYLKLDALFLWLYQEFKRKVKFTISYKGY